MNQDSPLKAHGKNLIGAFLPLTRFWPFPRSATSVWHQFNLRPCQKLLIETEKASTLLILPNIIKTQQRDILTPTTVVKSHCHIKQAVWRKKKHFQNLDILLNHKRRRNDSVLSVQVEFICNYRVKIHNFFCIGMFLIQHSCYFCRRSSEQCIDQGHAECWKKHWFKFFFICDMSLPKKCCVGTQTDKQTNDWLIRLAVLLTCNLEFDSTQQSYKNLWHICFAGYASAFRRQEYTDKNSEFTVCVMNTMYFSVKFLGFCLLQSL